MLLKGFTLIESLLVLFMLSALTVVINPSKVQSLSNFLRIQQIQQYVASQHFKVIYEHESACLDKSPFYSSTCFNRRGHINQAQTYYIDKTRLVFHLGFGHHEIQ